MARYIDAELIEYWDDVYHRYDEKFACKDDIDDIPTADVQEVKHAHWMFDSASNDGMKYYKCSCCERLVPCYCDEVLEMYPYCHCGAKMEAK